MKSFQTLNSDLSYDHPLLSLTPKTPSQVVTEICSMWASVLSVALSWDQPKCLLTEESINKTSYVNTAPKENKLSSFAGFTVHELSQSQNDNYHTVSFIHVSLAL